MAETISDSKKANYRKAVRRLGVSSLAATLLFTVLMFVCAAVNAGSLDIFLPEGEIAEYYVPEQDIVEVSPEPGDSRHLRVTARGRGKTFIGSGPGNDGHFEYVSVLPGRIVYDMSTGNFSGYRQFTVLVQAYVFIIAILMIASFIVRCRAELFSYTTLFFGGTALFLTSISVNVMLKLLSIAGSREEFTMLYVYSMIKSAGYTFMLLTLPLMAVFAVSLAVSNISLIRREGRSFVNLLGIILSGLIAAGYAVQFVLDNLFSMGSEFQMRVYNTVTSVYTTGFVYFEAMLLSSVICGLAAAKKKPAFDKTHIIILGCAISDDGTPLPLLRGRIDRALEFAAAQKAAGGKEVKFVPSGGQGSDEVVSEAESMRGYLLSKGIPPERIIPEDKSVNTKENMRFSLGKISADDPEPSIAFSTSNYHVLRSGIISRGEGLEADGIGAKTKWYFWPNAFVREFIGLLASKWRQHAFWILFFIVVFAAINMLIPM